MGLIALAGAAVSAGGCSSSEPARRSLTPGDFASASAPAQSGDASTKQAPAPAKPAPVKAAVAPTPAPAAPVAHDASAPSPAEVRSEPGAPALSANPGVLSDAVLIDAKIGDVNNRALYASGFLEPMEAELRAEAVRLNKAAKGDAAAVRQAWDVFAVQQIQRQLGRFIRDEIFRAEASASLKPEQKAGLQYYLQKMREEEIRKNQGSLTLTDEEIARQTGGKSLDEYMRSQEQRTLIEYQLIQQINRKVQVAWRDIKQQYERDAEKYNPPPTAFFRVILISKRDEAGLKAVTDGLAEGKDFAELAKSPANLLSRDKGGLQAVPFKGPLEEATLIGIKPVNEAVRKLAPGAVAGPIDNENTTAWVKLESIESKSVSLYDAQLAIENEIFAARQDRAIEAYMGKLQGRASLTDLDDMGQRVLQYARERVLEPVLRGPGPSGASPSAASGGGRGPGT